MQLNIVNFFFLMLFKWNENEPKCSDLLLLTLRNSSLARLEPPVYVEILTPHISFSLLTACDRYIR